MHHIYIIKCAFILQPSISCYLIKIGQSDNMQQESKQQQLTFQVDEFSTKFTFNKVFDRIVSFYVQIGRQQEPISEENKVAQSEHLLDANCKYTVGPIFQANCTLKFYSVFGTFQALQKYLEKRAGTDTQFLKINEKNKFFEILFFDEIKQIQRTVEFPLLKKINKIHWNTKSNKIQKNQNNNILKIRKAFFIDQQSYQKKVQLQQELKNSFEALEKLREQCSRHNNISIDINNVSELAATLQSYYKKAMKQSGKKQKYPEPEKQQIKNSKTIKEKVFTEYPEVIKKRRRFNVGTQNIQQCRQEEIKNAKESRNMSSVDLGFLNKNKSKQVEEKPEIFLKNNQENPFIIRRNVRNIDQSYNYGDGQQLFTCKLVHNSEKKIKIQTEQPIISQQSQSIQKQQNQKQSPTTMKQLTPHYESCLNNKQPNSESSAKTAQAQLINSPPQFVSSENKQISQVQPEEKEQLTKKKIVQQPLNFMNTKIPQSIVDEQKKQVKQSLPQSPLENNLTPILFKKQKFVISVNNNLRPPSKILQQHSN